MGLYHFFKDFAGPIATGLAAVAALFVTWRLGKSQLLVAKHQADVATVRLKHDLFDRRFEIYETVLFFLIEILQSSNMSREGMSKFVRGTQKAVFVFDQPVTDFFEHLRRQAVILQETAAFLNDQNNRVGEERTAAARRRSELFTWFTDQFPVLVDRLKPFMALDENTASRPYLPIVR
jgi:hypothetical protein